jgi:hypothetical protein
MSIYGGKTCFVAAPIGELASATRERSDCVLDCIIRPAVEPLGFTVSRLDRIHTPGRLSYQAVLGSIVADLMIADLTDGNPNVLYEVGIRHSFGGPYVQLIERGQKIPFDVADIRTLLVDSTSPAGIERAVSDLSLQAAAAISVPLMRDHVRLFEFLLETGFDDWFTDPLRSDPSGGLPIPTVILSELQGWFTKNVSGVHPPRWTKLDRLLEDFTYREARRNYADSSLSAGADEEKYRQAA